MKGKKKIQRIRHTLSGQVQGVGFRPFLFQLAKKYKLTGSVKNTPEGVTLEVQGENEALSSFTNALLSTLPPLARINSHLQQELLINKHEKSFHIIKSVYAERSEGHNVLISPDIGVCKECINDIEETSRRKGYAFTNCTNCGPRYSITQSVPYDRETTSMACFPLCSECEAEYKNPNSRRFHAQPNACPVCGPIAWFTKDPTRSQLEQALSTGQQAIKSVAQLLCEGGIIALKGLGGFQLVCDAGNLDAVTRLRHKKRRPDKPLAIMTDSLESAKKIGCINAVAEKWLTCPEKPITLCPVHKETFSSIVPTVAPMMQRIGIMLPYTPLHHLLLQSFIKIKGSHKGAPALVVTSGNRASEPIAIGNREALTSLQNIAEGWLFHNRDILVRVDDSVILPLDEDYRTDDMPDTLFLRRARGFVPLPIGLPSFEKKISAQKAIPLEKESFNHTYKEALEETIEKKQELLDTFQGKEVSPVLMGAGADLKNTFCLTKGSNAFISQHIGDMHTIETEEFYVSTKQHMTRLLAITPEYIIRDLHPDYAVTRVTEAFGLPFMSLQHHAAHAFSVLGENSFEARSLALTLDGLGFGEDGGLWGGEALIVNMQDGTWSRAGSLSDIPLPGGDIAVKEPWRIAHALMLEQDIPCNNMPWIPVYSSTAEHISCMLEKKLNTPYTSSCGRLFDAVSALLGICLSTTYEGQAAILLEQAQWGDRALLSSAQLSPVQISSDQLAPPHASPDQRVSSPVFPAQGATSHVTVAQKASSHAKPTHRGSSYVLPTQVASSPAASAQRESSQIATSQMSPFHVLPTHILPDLQTSPLSVLPEEDRYIMPIIERKDRLILDSRSMFAALCREREKGVSSALLSRKFHQSLAYGLCDLSERLCRKNNLTHVGLSGGVMQNTTLLYLLCKELKNRGLVPLTHRSLPSGDGGLSFGQVVWGSIRLRAKSI